MAAVALRDVFRAHQAWKINRAMQEQVRGVSDRHTTNPAPANPETDRDGWQKSDGW
jgi:hypothetical protein